MLQISHAPLPDVDTLTAYRIFWLRSRVFIVEQDVPEPDLDGRELESGAFLVWGELEGDPVTTLRVLREGDGWVIGRVATDLEHRSKGLAARLIRYTLDLLGDAPVELHAQAHLQRWYADQGFTREGEVFLEAGIPHVLMRRDT